MAQNAFVSVFLDGKSMPIPTILRVSHSLEDALGAFDLDSLPAELRHGFRGGVVLETEAGWRGKLALDLNLGLDHNEIRHIRLDAATGGHRLLRTHGFPSGAPSMRR